MINTCKNTIILGLLLLLSSNYIVAQELPTKKPFKIPAKKTKTQERNTKNSTKIINSTEKKTIVIDSSEQVKASLLKGAIPHKATDYIKMDRKENKMYLYNEAKITYNGIDIEAGLIIIDFNKDEIYATGIKDSLGKLTQRPVFTQDGSVSTHDEMRVNYKTKKALLHNSVSEMEDNKELKYFLAYSKKENDSVIFAKDARITTAEDVYNPEYYIHIHKMKLIPNKKIIAGYSHLVIENVPTPLGIPFAFFPITETQTSGILMPVWGDDSRYGYFLQNGGYYFAISDHLDLALQGSIYMNGSYGVKLNSNYKKRYHYGGRFSVDYSNMITSERGFPNYQVNKLYKIQWNHSPDRKSSPNSSFNASVNYSSSQFYRDNVDVNYQAQQLNNISTSSLNYTNNMVGTPFNPLSVSTSINQNFNTQKISLSLPNISTSIKTFFPFAKLFKKKNIISSLNLNYNLNATNSINTDEDHFFKSGMFDKAKTGIVHSSSISTNFNALKYVHFSISGNYNEVWNLQTQRKHWDGLENRVQTDTIAGFEAFRTYNYNISANTTFYGLFRFKAGKKLQAIRHAVTPSITYTNTPSFEQYYDEYQASIDPNDIADYTRFAYVGRNVPGRNKTQNIGFAINNDFEAKINKKDSLNPDAKPEKIKLLQSLNISTSYNMLADSLKWSPVSISGNIPLFKSKMNIRLSSSYSFYAKDASGRSVNVFNHDAGGSWLRFQNFNASTGYSFSSKNSSNSSTKFQKGGKATNNTKSKAEESYYNFKIPWTVTFTYGINITDRGITRNTLAFSGKVDLTPKWHIGYRSGYDFQGKGFSNTSFNIDRDLDSWTMHFNWTPKGYRNSWGFFIGIKSSVLSDIKWDKQGP